MSDTEARTMIEALRWPNGPVCPHCGSIDNFKLTTKLGSKTPVRDGVYQCSDAESFVVSTRFYNCNFSVLLFISQHSQHKSVLIFFLIVFECQIKLGIGWRSIISINR